MAGDIATQMASAPLADKGDKRKANPLHQQFKLESFQLPNKASQFKNDDGTITERLAYAHLRLLPSGMPFTASVYLAKKLNGDEELYLAMPSTGKGFPRPVFVPDTPTLQAHYDTWRFELAQRYEAWEAELKAKAAKEGTAAIASSSARLVRKTAAPVATTT